MNRAWQKRAWAYYDEVGEIHYAGRFIGSALSKIRLVGAEMEPGGAKGKRSPKPTDNAQIVDAVAKLKSEKGGQGALLRSMGANVFVAGEVLLIGYEKEGTQVWEGLSVDELLLRPGDKNLYRKRTPDAPPTPVPEGALIIRCWQEHPRYSGFPDSAMRSILDECEKLLLLTRADKAAARSRFAGSGLLFIPNELVPTVQQPTGDETSASPAQNPVLTQLAKAMIEPIKDESHPSAVVPVVLFGPAEYGQYIKYTTFDRQMDRMSASRREEAITRIATAIDLPNEILTGKADLNHWTSWQIHEETFQAHLQPFVELICDALTVGYLQPALKRAGIKDPEKYVIWYDSSELVVRPDRTELAAALFADNLVSGEARRAEAGFDENDKMDDKEYAQRVGLLLKDAKMAITGEIPEPVPAVPDPGAGMGRPSDFAGNDKNAPGKASGSPVAADSTKTSSSSNGDSPSEPSTGGQSKAKPIQQSVTAKSPRPGSAAANRDQKNRKGLTASADPPVVGLGRKLAQLDVDLMMRLRVAADEVLDAALSRAGARIRSKAQGSTVKDTIRETPNHLVASVLGASLVASLDLTDHELMKGAFAAFAAKVGGWIKMSQTERSRLIAQFAREHPEINDGGLTAADLDDLYGTRDKSSRELALAALVTGLVGLASQRLYAPNTPVPPNGEVDGISVPASLVRRVVDIAGGGGNADTTAFATESASGGIGTGAIAREMFGGIGMRPIGFEWVYGSEPRRPFQAHVELDGTQFETMQDDVLKPSEEDGWIDGEYLHPGDHIGCLCAVAPIFAGIPDTVPDTLLTEASA